MKKRIYFCVIFFCVIFSNFEIGSILLSDIIYTLIACIAMIQSKKISTYGVYKYVFIFLVLTVLSFFLHSHLRGLLGCLRFVYGITICSILFSTYNRNQYRQSVVNGYCDACFLFSLFIIFQIFCYYILKINVEFSFAEYSREVNYAAAYDPLDSLLYRTGGFFKVQ